MFMKQLFISYDTGSDSLSANRVANYLKRRDLEVWIAPNSIRPGEEWVDAIGRGLETSSHFALVSTPNAYLSKWVRKEYNAALLLEAEGEIEVIPLEVEKTKIPLFLRGFQSISFIDKFEAGLYQLSSLLGVAELDGASESTPVAKPDPDVEVADPCDNGPFLDWQGSGSVAVGHNLEVNNSRVGDIRGIEEIRAKEPKVFVAYDVRDQAYAQLLSKVLRVHGITKWMAPESIETGARWGVAIVDAIVDSTAVIVIMSPRSARSQWVSRELAVTEREGIPVFPILLAGEPFPSLRNYQFFDAREGDLPSERFIEKLKR